MKPVVALLGRPNVGKSTLFNRITGSRRALVNNMPGVTRDRQYLDTEWEGADFQLVDTGGFLRTDDDAFAADIREQLEVVIGQADILVGVMDGRQGVTPYDRDLADILRKTSKPVFYLVNKIDSGKLEDNLYDFYSLGVERLYAVSGEHGLGVGDFLDDMVAALPSGVASEDTGGADIKIAVVGRPNVGKSSLVNRLFGETRVIVNEQAGTTRDALEIPIEKAGRRFSLMDTAGIRRKARVVKKIEKFSIIKSLESMEVCDVALILLDAAEGVTDQDVTIAGYAEKRGCGVLFLLNKWDLVEKSDKIAQKHIDELRQRAKFLSFAPAVTISALSGLRCRKILDAVESVYSEYTARVSTGFLNRVIADAVTSVEPPLHNGRRIKFFYATQVGTAPPTFICFVNYPGAVHFSYQRYLVNQIRAFAGLEKTPVRLYFRERPGKRERPVKGGDERRVKKSGAAGGGKRQKQRRR